MSEYSLAHLSDSALLAGTSSLVARDRATTAELLAHLAEVDARKLYLPAAYPSMFAWCVGQLRFSEDTAYKRIRAARAARMCPSAFAMIADGRLALSGLVLLSAVLSTENAVELLEAAAGMTNEGIERLIAERFPKSEAFELEVALARTTETPAASSASVEECVCPDSVCDSREQLAVRPVHAPAAAASEPNPGERAHLAPISGGRFALTVTLSRETHDAFKYAQSLLGHAVPDGDLAHVLDRALAALVAQLEKQRFGKCSRSRQVRTPTRDGSRHIAIAVRRQVWERDGGRCTFTSEHGHRCESRTRLEFDHVEPVARGGSSTPGNLRLRCRAHNQHAAERAFGHAFMAHQREEARRRAAAAREARRAQEAQKAIESERLTKLQAQRDELIPYLRQLGYSLPTARLASAVCDTMPDASLEDRLRAALKSLVPSSVRVERPGGRDAA